MDDERKMKITDDPRVYRAVWCILRTLERKEPRTIHDLRRSGFISSLSTLEKYVGMLEKRGLVATEKINSFPIKRLVRLTDGGRRALESVDKLGKG